MGLQIRDERQMKALTGLSQAQFDHLLPVFSDLYRATQQQTYEEGIQAGTRRRHPGGRSKGQLLKRCTRSLSKPRSYEETMRCRFDPAPEPMPAEATHLSPPCCVSTHRSRVVDPDGPQRFWIPGRLSPYTTDDIFLHKGLDPSSASP
jgi:hypothetical protein